MSVVHTGSTKKFAAGWDAIFSGRKSAAAGRAGKPARPSAAAPRAASKKVKAPTKKAKSRSR